MNNEVKLHSFTVSVDYTIECYSDEEALAFFDTAEPIIVHVEDNGPIE